MHLVMILTALGLAVIVRLIPLNRQQNWRQRWQQSLFLFMFPPLLLMATALAVSCMGYGGQMFGIPAGWFSYLLAWAFIACGVILFLKLFYQAHLSTQKVRTYPQQIIAGKKARIIEIAFPYIAQIGLYKPELTISRGLLEILDSEHLQAVLAHEQAHKKYRDTFWFFLLGWLHTFTAYLPRTEFLWQELLLLRELRADWQAASKVDPLLLAESLLIVTRNSKQVTFNPPVDSFCAAFNDFEAQSRVVERIELLLNNNESNLPATYYWWDWFWLSFAFLPLFTVPWHY